MRMLKWDRHYRNSLNLRVDICIPPGVRVGVIECEATVCRRCIQPIDVERQKLCEADHVTTLSTV